MTTRFITLAIHTYEKAVTLRSLLESEGIPVEFRNVNIEHPIVSSGVRVRIREIDLPLALRIIENHDIFAPRTETAESAIPTHPILVPVDFSDMSLKAAIQAFCLANRHGTSIVLLHTYIDPYIAGSMQLTDSLTYEINDTMTREQVGKMASTQMRHFANRLRDMIKKGDLPPVKFTTKVVEGVPEDAITEYCRTRHPFLIVMGTRGPQRKEMDMIGSVTAEVLDKCRFSVLAIPEDDESAPDPTCSVYSNVLYFSNSDQQDILALDTLHRVFPDQRLTVTLCDIPAKKIRMRDNTQALKAIQEYCSTNFPEYNFKIANLKAENTIEEIHALETDNPFDLIVVPNKKKNIFARLFSPTIAHRILFSSSRPLLVIPV